MGIHIDKISKGYMKNVSRTAMPDKVDTKETKGRHFDEIVISSSKQQIEEKKITEEFSGKVVSEVKVGTSPQKLSKLEEAIKNGEYIVDSERLAAKILLFKDVNIDE